MNPYRRGVDEALQQEFESNKNPVKQVEQLIDELQTEHPFEQALN